MSYENEIPAAEQVAEPTPDQTPAPAAPAQGTPPQGDGPWMSDLQALGLDGNALSSVDAYLRTQWQPRVTQLEQSIAQLRPAEQLYADLTEDPVDTYLAITSELYGDDVAERVTASLRESGVLEDDEPTEPVTGETQQLDPRVAEVVQHYERERARKEYEEAKAEVLARPENSDIDGELLDPFVAAAGDMEVAVAAYRNYYAKMREKLGVPAVTPADVPDAPPTLGAGGSASTTAPPVQKQYANFDEALDDFFAESKPAPPTLGTT